MAPEQARGESVDQRADIYALGLIFSDMLLGARTGCAADAFEELQAAHRTRRRRPVRTVDATIPEAIDRIDLALPRAGSRASAIRRRASWWPNWIASMRTASRSRSCGVGLRARDARPPWLVLALLGGTHLVTRRAVEPPVQHEPVSVLIADFQNGTSDPTFDRTLEPMLKLALEGAGFISAYDRTGIARSLGRAAAREARRGGGAGDRGQAGRGRRALRAVTRQGNGYERFGEGRSGGHRRCDRHC